MSAFGGFGPLPIRLGGSATEGWSAAQHARAAADLSAATFACPFAWVTMTLRNGDGNNPTLLAYNSMPGNGVFWAPTLVKLTDGVARVLWGQVFSDSYGVPEPLALRHAKATAQSASARIANAYVLSDLASVEVRVYDAAGILANDTVTLKVT